MNKFGINEFRFSKRKHKQLRLILRKDQRLQDMYVEHNRDQSLRIERIRKNALLERPDEFMVGDLLYNFERYYSLIVQECDGLFYVVPVWHIYDLSSILRHQQDDIGIVPLKYIFGRGKLFAIMNDAQWLTSDELSSYKRIDVVYPYQIAILQNILASWVHLGE